MTFNALITILALSSIPLDAQAKTHLRPFAARHAAAHHAKPFAARHAAADHTKKVAAPAHFRLVLPAGSESPAATTATLKPRPPPQPASNSVDVDELAETAARQAENEAKQRMKQTISEETKKPSTPSVSSVQPPSNSVDIDDTAETVADEAETKVKVTTPTPTIAPAVPAAVAQLNKDLVEVKQMRTNVAVVEKALAADVTLLRETATLQRMASTPGSRKAAKVQLHQAEQLVKATEAMVKKSRGDAEDRARAALQEATEVQNAVGALMKEAKSMVKKAKPAKKPKAAVRAAPAKEDNDGSDDGSDASM